MEDMDKGSGASTTDSGATSGDEGQKASTISRDDHERALKDLHKFKAQVGDLSKKLTDHERALKQREEEKLASEGKLQELAEIRAKERDEATQKLRELEEQRQKDRELFWENQKYDAVVSGLKQRGLREEAIEDVDALDLTEIHVERTDRGRALFPNLPDVLDRIKNKKPHWFKSSSSTVVNSGGRTVVDGVKSFGPKEIVDLERRWKMTGRAEDKKAYMDAYQTYVRSKKAK